jgi:Uncharacterized protein conserved in bacteria (DUF2147)
LGEKKDDNSKQENGHNISTSTPVRENGAPLGVEAAEGAFPVGAWKNEDAKIEIFKEGGKLDGRIAALNEKYTEDGQKKQTSTIQIAEIRTAAQRAR